VTGVLRRRERGTQRPCEDTARKWSCGSEGEVPKEPNVLTT
jgi:hypothetical protein